VRNVLQHFYSKMMTEYNLASIFVELILGIGKVAVVFMAIYIPFHAFVKAISFKNIL